jgi:hypothetical protein
MECRGCRGCMPQQRHSKDEYVLTLLLLRQGRVGVAHLDASSAANARIAIGTAADVTVAIRRRVKVDFARDGVKGVAFALRRVLQTDGAVEAFEGTGLVRAQRFLSVHERDQQTCRQANEARKVLHSSLVLFRCVVSRGNLKSGGVMLLATPTGRLKSFDARCCRCRCRCSTGPRRFGPFRAHDPSKASAEVRAHGKLLSCHSGGRHTFSAGTAWTPVDSRARFWRR